MYEQTGRISHDLAEILRKYYKEQTVDVLVQRSHCIPPETEQMLYHMALEQKKKSNIFIRILKGIGKAFVVCFKAWWAPEDPFENFPFSVLLVALKVLICVPDSGTGKGYYDFRKYTKKQRNKKSCRNDGNRRYVFQRGFSQ